MVLCFKVFAVGADCCKCKLANVFWISGADPIFAIAKKRGKTGMAQPRQICAGRLKRLVGTLTIIYFFVR